MKHPRIFFMILLSAALIILMCPIHADTGTQAVLYQNAFATNPTGRPTTHLRITGIRQKRCTILVFSQYPEFCVLAPINYGNGSFTLQYDVNLTELDPGATFRLGFSGTDMDFNKGPNVITEFTNAKYGLIMVLHSVTQNAKQEEVSSDTSSYPGPTVTYALNTTYHVKVDYNADTDVVTETVTNKATGGQVWSYFITIPESLKKYEPDLYGFCW